MLMAGISLVLWVVVIYCICCSRCNVGSTGILKEDHKNLTNTKTDWWIESGSGGPPVSKEGLIWNKTEVPVTLQGCATYEIALGSSI